MKLAMFTILNVCVLCVHMQVNVVVC